VSDKPHASLDPLDRRLRDALPPPSGFTHSSASGVQLRIDKVCGFELFNTRPYHNHETWSDGYEVVGTVDGSGWSPIGAFEDAAREEGLQADAIRTLWRIATGQQQHLLRVRAEDLDDALDSWFLRREKVAEVLRENPPLPNQRTRLAVLGYHYSE